MARWNKPSSWIPVTLIALCAAQGDDCETGPIVFPGATTNFIFPEFNTTCSGAMLEFRGGYLDPVFIPIEGAEDLCGDSFKYGSITLSGSLPSNREAKLTLLCDDWDEGPCIRLSVGQQQSDALLEPVITLSCRAMGDQPHAPSSPPDPSPSKFSTTVPTSAQPTGMSSAPPRSSTASLDMSDALPDVPTDLSSGLFSEPPSSGTTGIEAPSLPTTDPITSGSPAYTCACT